MTEASLNARTLHALEACRLIALESTDYLKCVYDDLDDGSDRDMIGHAMAQKQSFIGAVEAILANHDIEVEKTVAPRAANDCDDTLHRSQQGQHLNQEERFRSAIKNCISATHDKMLEELLNHHLEASDIELTAIKTSSLKL